MGERITVIGGTDSAIAVTLDGTQAMNLANQFAQDLQDYYIQGKVNFTSVTADPNVVDDQLGYGVITQGGSYNAGNGYDYIVAGGYNYTQSPIYFGMDGETNYEVNPSTANILNEAVTINSVMNASQTVNVLAGNTNGFTYNAGEESGQLLAGNANSNVAFQGNTLNGGSWTIAVGTGHNTINAGSGVNIIYSGNAQEAAGSRGNSYIDVTNGITNQVTSEGQDTIVASQDSDARNSVVLNGGSSQYASVSLNSGVSVIDNSFYNSVTVGGGSTIQGGSAGNYNFDGSYNDYQSTFNSGYQSNITANNTVMVIHGDSNTVTGSQDVAVLNAIGNETANVTGTAAAFGADGLNMTLNATGNASGLFVADVGNETLNASGSTAAIAIYANTVVGGNTNFVAIGGSNNDQLVAGTGNSTFTGGAGDNLFMFNKDSDQGGTTVITDFTRAGSNNKIGLYNYGIDTDSLQALLNSSSDDANGDAVLKLENHTITIEGVHVSDLTVSQFDGIAASPAKSS